MKIIIKAEFQHEVLERILRVLRYRRSEVLEFNAILKGEIYQISLHIKEGKNILEHLSKLHDIKELYEAPQ
ncbi:MAG: hypothetical protein E7K04_02105 [Helicobacter sp.]|nr:hypothetical protein [Helicobacter sp.]